MFLLYRIGVLFQLFEGFSKAQKSKDLIFPSLRKYLVR